MESLLQQPLEQLQSFPDAVHMVFANEWLLALDLSQMATRRQMIGEIFHQGQSQALLSHSQSEVLLEQLARQEPTFVDQLTQAVNEAQTQGLTQSLPKQVQRLLQGQIVTGLQTEGQNLCYQLLGGLALRLQYTPHEQLLLEKGQQVVATWEISLFPAVHAYLLRQTLLALPPGQVQTHQILKLMEQAMAATGDLLTAS
jgi:hypothetical protein